VRLLQICAVDFTAFHLLRPLLVASREEGWTVEFACANGPLAARLVAEGFRYREIPITRSPSPIRLANAALRLAANLRMDPPDLIHTHTPVGGLVGRAGALAWGGPVVHTFHGIPFEDEDLSLRERLYLRAERALARRTTYFFSQARGDAVRAVSFGIARERDLTVIGNGVDTARFAPDPAVRAAVRSELGIPNDALVVTTVARLVREKGILEFAEAAMGLANDPRLHVLIVGAALASDRTAIDNELDRHPVVARLGSRWHRLGHREDVPRLLRATDIFVLPTYREGLPRSLIEAMAAGLAVIASDIPACRELVRANETGLLVPPRDATALHHSIASLLADPARRMAMGARGREVAERDHNERDVLRRQLDIFARLVHR
jgi:glycosyltransferase involved in cell wall biosynthesis